MKKFNSSALTHKRAEVMKAARDGGAIIQLKETNGEVREEFVFVAAKDYFNITDDVTIYCGVSDD